VMGLVKQVIGQSNGSLPTTDHRHYTRHPDTNGSL
jgi:hypothetical protein